MTKSRLVSIVMIGVIGVLLFFKFHRTEVDYREDIVDVEIPSGTYTITKDTAGIFDVEILENTIINNIVYSQGEYFENIRLFPENWFNIEGKVKVDGRYDGDEVEYLSAGTYIVDTDIQSGTYQLTLEEPGSLNELLIRSDDGSEVIEKYTEADFPLQISIEFGEDLLVNANQSKAISNMIKVDRVD